MKNFTLLILINLIAFSLVHSQCSNFNGQYPFATQSTISNTLQTVVSCAYGGEYGVYEVTAGETYTWTTCGDVTFNTQLTLWNTAHTTVYAYNDDDCGLQSTITWTATFTGNVHVLISEFNCNNFSGCMTIQWACTSCGSGATCSDGIQNQGETGIDCGGPCPACPPTTTTIIPTVCANATYTLPAGTSANFYDDGGPGGNCGTDGFAGNFANANCETITTICAAPGEYLIANFSVFSMFGTTSGFDWMVIYEGPSTSGTILYDNRNGSPDNPHGTSCTYDGSSLSLCAVGECLTFEFHASGVVNREGWDALVSSVPIACTPLPVELLNFSGEKQGNTNELSWVTATESNNDYFILEYSPDGKSWEEIQNINGSGNSNTKNTYSTTHRDFQNGINYYRLTQVDFNGKRNVFEIVSIDNSVDRTLLKRINTMGQEVNENYRGIVILYYSDGTIEKTFF